MHCFLCIKSKFTLTCWQNYFVQRIVDILNWITVLFLGRELGSTWASRLSVLRDMFIPCVDSFMSLHSITRACLCCRHMAAKCDQISKVFDDNWCYCCTAYWTTVGSKKCIQWQYQFFFSAPMPKPRTQQRFWHCCENSLLMTIQTIPHNLCEFKVGFPLLLTAYPGLS